MRQISLRPKCKLRGVKRRLRNLSEWSQSLEISWSSDFLGKDSVYLKAPVLDRLVNPPTTKRSIQRQFIREFINAADRLISSKPEQYRDYVINVNFTYPMLHGSDIIIFKNSGDYEKFYSRDTLTRIDRQQTLFDQLGIDIPAKFTVEGFDFYYKDEWEEVFAEWWLVTESYGKE